MGRSRRGLAVAAALVAVVALVVWLAWGGRGDAGSAAMVPGAARGADGHVLPSFAVEDPAAPAPDAAPLVAVVPSGDAASPSGAPRLVVRVTWAADGTPAEGITLHLFVADRPDPSHNLIDGLTDAQGLWALEPAPLGTVGVYADRGGSVVGKVEPGQITELALALPPGTLVKGRVLDPDERPVARAEIWLSDMTNSTVGAVVTLADEAGRFAVRGVGGTRWIGARGAGWQPSPLVEIPREPPPEMEVELRLGRPGGTVRGVVLDARAQGLPGAFVQIGPGTGWPGPEPAPGVQRGHGPPPFRLRTAADGSFAAADVPPGVVDIEVIAVGWTPFSTSIDVLAGETQELRLQLEPGATVQGTVRDAAGVAVERAVIKVGTHPTEPGYVRVTSDAAGHYVLRDPPKGQQEFSATKPKVGEDRSSLSIEPGQTYSWDPVLAAGLQIVGRVVDESGAPVEGLQVRCMHGAQFDGFLQSAKVAADGRFAIPNLEDREYRLTVSEGSGPQLAALDAVRPGSGEVLIRIAADAHLFATVVARVVDARGVPPLGLEAHLAPVGESFGVSAKVDATTGGISFDKVPAGDERLYVLVQGRPPLTQDVPNLRSGEHRDLGTIVLGDPGRVVLRVALPAGAGPGDVMPILDRAEGGGGMQLDLQDGTPLVWISRPVAPGDYIVSLYSTSGGDDHVFVVPQAAAVRVEAGADARVDLVADRGVAQNIQLSTPNLDPPKTWLRVTDAAGAAVCDETVRWDDAEPGATKRESYTSFVAKPGAYTLVVESDGQPVVQQALTLSGAVNMAPNVSLVVP